MIKVITYGTYDFLHYGHTRLLERAKALGDYLIVGVTADDFDKNRGKINVHQSLMERIEAVRSTGLADEIIIEEYEGQKIDDIKRYGIDIFTVGSDWVGKFDYLNEYCKVVYLERTEGISSTEIRAQSGALKIGLVGDSVAITKFERESHFVNGVKIAGFYSETQEEDRDSHTPPDRQHPGTFYQSFLAPLDAVYIASHPSRHYAQIREALLNGKHVLCELPVSLWREECQELFRIARERNCILMAALKTAYATAYSRLLLLVKSGRIGRLVSVDATCTSLRKVDIANQKEYFKTWNSICSWGHSALLPVFQLLGTDFSSKRIVSNVMDDTKQFDLFTRIDFRYPHAVASIKVGKGIKSEGELIISGTEGYIYVPAPWWKTDYFELRYENPAENKRYFYQLEGEGIRYEIVSFVQAIEKKKCFPYIEEKITEAISGIMEDFYSGTDVEYI